MFLTLFDKMSFVQEKSILDLPNEILEDHVLPYLSHNDLQSLIKSGEEKLAECSKRAARKKPFCK